MSVASIACTEPTCNQHFPHDHPGVLRRATAPFERPRRSSSQDRVASVVDAIGELIAIGNLSAFPERLLGILCGAIASDVALFIEAEPAAPRFVLLVRPADMAIPVTLGQLASCLSEERAFLGAALPADGAPWVLSDVTGKLYRETSAYCELFGPIGAEHQLVFRVPTDDSVQVEVRLGRSHIDFTKAERELLEMLRPHIAGTLAHLRRADRLGRILKVVAGGRPCVTVRIDRAGEMTLIGGGPSVVQRWFPAGSMLRRDLHDWAARQHRDASSNGRTVDRRVAGRVAEAMRSEPFVVRSLDVMLVAHWRGPAVDGDVVDIEEVIVEGTELRALGLTMREAEVLAMLLIGAEAAAIALRLGSRPATVKKQIENLYRKLGVHNRREAVTIALDAMISAG